MGWWLDAALTVRRRTGRHHGFGVDGRVGEYPALRRLVARDAALLVAGSGQTRVEENVLAEQFDGFECMSAR